MTQEKFKKIDELRKYVEDLAYYLNNHVVWENQEGQEEHFDKYNKGEQIALIDMSNKAQALDNAIQLYKHWFIDK